MNTSQVKTSIQPLELQRLLATGAPAQLLDVRTPGEFATAHVPGAKLIPLDDLKPDAFRRERGAEEIPVYVLCQSGGRARKAIEKLERAGVQGCVLVEGGTQAWIDAGLPTERTKSSALPLMRQVQITVGFVSAVGAALALAVNPLFAIIPLVMGGGLLFAGLTGICGLALLLAKMPWNRAQGCGSCCETKGGA
ncbi:MAG: rhodanese-like domain-containing protein [Limisphaerales bacterium]|jgi:rhodanese-related sulfurtransferase